MTINDPRPNTLRAEELADDVPALAFALADHLHSINEDATHLLAILASHPVDVGRTLARVQAGAAEIQETSARAQDSLETLARTLRAAGALTLPGLEPVE